MWLVSMKPLVRVNHKLRIMDKEERRKYFYEKNKIYRQRKIDEHRCERCGKPVAPLKCPHCSEVLKYNMRCTVCTKINNRKSKDAS